MGSAALIRVGEWEGPSNSTPPPPSDQICQDVGKFGIKVRIPSSWVGVDGVRMVALQSHVLVILYRGSHDRLKPMTRSHRHLRREWKANRAALRHIPAPVIKHTFHGML